MNYAITKRSYVALPAHLAVVALVTFVVVSSTRPASAAIILQKSAGTPLPQGNLVQYTISAVGTAGEMIASFSNPSITPIGASLGIHNVAQGFTNAGTPTIDEHAPGLWNSEWAAYDTYYFLRSGLTFGTPITETNNGATTGMLGLSPTPTVPRSGFGTYNSQVSSERGVLPAEQDSNVTFMQVVLQAEDSARLRVRVGAIGGIIPPDFAQEIVIGPFVVPEPATIALLAVAAIGLISHRRRDRRWRVYLVARLAAESRIVRNPAGCSGCAGSVRYAGRAGRS